MTTEASTVADLALKGANPQLIDLVPGHQYRLVTPHGVETISTDHLDPAPRRATGHTSLHDPNSLITFVRKYSAGHAGTETSETSRAGNAEKSATAIYADNGGATLTAVINGHGPDTPGWGDHRATLRLVLTPEWKHWASQDKKWLSQHAFAEHIEEGLDEIVEPAAADMLEVVQTLIAHNRVEFKSQTILANGQRQFTYAETVEAKAGQAGNVTIPQRFALGIIPYEGSVEAYRILARFQFRISDGSLHIRYLLTRPHDILRAAFDDTVEVVEAGTGLRAFRGLPPQQ